MKWLLRGVLPAILLASCGGNVGSPAPAPAANTPTAAAATAPALAKTFDPTTNDLFCGVLSENSITSGQGSGPNTFELRPTTSVRTGSIGSARFGGWISADRPALGTYVCVWLSQGAPMGGFQSQVRSGAPGYIAEILPNGFALPQNCAYVGQATSEGGGLSVTWKVDCGAIANRSARATLAPALTQQGWISCGSGLASEIWSKNTSRLAIAEGSGAAGDYPTMAQHLAPAAPSNAGCP
jgi:hypothetical protein